MNRDYIQAVAAISPYPADRLSALHSGELSTAEPLKDLLDRLKGQLGEVAFNHQCEKLGLTEEEIITFAEKGVLRESSDRALAELLGLTRDEIVESAIAQIQTKIIPQI